MNAPHLRRPRRPLGTLAACALLAAATSQAALAGKGAPHWPAPLIAHQDVPPGSAQPVELPEALQDLRGIAPDRKAQPGTQALAAPPPLFPASPAALRRDKLLALTDFSLQRPDAAEVARLRTQALAAPVRVIVTLAMPLTPAGLLGELGARDQEARIASLQNQVLATLGSLGVEVLHQYNAVPMLALKVSGPALDLLALAPGVARIQADSLNAPTLDVSVPLIGAADVQDRGFAGNPWVVAVLDTGIDRSHPFLRGFVGEACFSGNANCPNGATTQTGAGAGAACTYASGCFHGTHVSGIAIGAAQAGFTSLNGVAPQAHVMPIQVFSRFTGASCSGGEDPCTRAFTSDIIAGLQYVFNQRGNFPIASANMSLGGGSSTTNCDSDTRKPIIDQLRSVNIATVISAGNSGLTDSLGAPGCISTAISVGATDDADTVASFSNSSSFLSLLAPGVSTLSSCPGSVFCIASGTSMAAPHTAGAFALLQSQSNRTVSSTLALLQNTGKPVADTRSGAGGRIKPRIDVLAASGLNNVELVNFTPRNFRNPLPIPHQFNFTGTQPVWTAVAVRPEPGTDIDLRLLDNADGTGPLASSAFGSNVIDVVVENNNTGFRPYGQDFVRANFFGGNNPGRYEIELNTPASTTLDPVVSRSLTSERIIDLFEFDRCGDSAEFLRVVPNPSQDLELLVFNSRFDDLGNPDPGFFAQGRPSAMVASVGGAGEAESLAFGSVECEDYAVAVLQKSGSGDYTLYHENSGSAPDLDFVIDGGNAVATDRDLVLSINASDAETGITDMAIALDGVLDNEPYQPYSPTVNVTYPDTGDTANIQVEVRNGAGVPARASDTIAFVAPALFSITDASLTEGNSGTAAMRFTVSLSRALTVESSVRVSTQNGVALSGPDYVGKQERLVFAAGQTSQSFDVLINGDTTVEPNETFQVNLDNPLGTGASIGDAQGIGTIVNDDVAAAPSSLSVNDVTVTEGNAGTKAATFTVTLTPAATATVSVTLSTADISASAGSDYVARTVTLNFAAGQTSKTVGITVNGDTLAEATETFAVNLTNVAGNGVLGDGQGIGTIVNDDAAPSSISISDASVSEGNSGSSLASFTVSLSPAPSSAVSVAYATANGSATAGSDYVATSGVLNFAAGQSTATVNVSISGDTVGEPDEDFFVNLSAPSGATLADAQGRGVISNDDAAGPTLSIDDVSLTEGNAGTRNATFTVRLNPAAAATVRVTFSTADGTAQAGSDYLARTVNLNFAAGQTVKTVAVTLQGDTLSEANETYFVNLSGLSGPAVIGDAQGLGTIVNDDGAPPPGISVSDQSIVEGNSGTGNALFTVSLTAASSSPVTVNVATAEANVGGSNSATSGTDFVPLSQSLTIPAGQTSATFAVGIIGDTQVEPAEVFNVVLSSPVGATLLDSLGVGQIENDDAAGPSLSVNDASVTEGNSGTKNLTFTVTLSQAVSETVRVTLSTADGTATAGSDYLARIATLNFTTGQTSKSISITLNGDTSVEATETFFVNLSNVSGGGAVISDAQGLGRIINDD